MEKLLTIRELAERLNISTGTAYHWLSAGRLRCVRFSTRCVRFREDDVLEMLDQLSSQESGLSSFCANNQLKEKHK